MSTKKIQILDSLVKNAENANTLEGKSASDFAAVSDLEALQTQVGDSSVADQISTAIGLIDYPVDSVNGKTGAVVLTASDVGALPSTTAIPSIDGLATETYVDEQVASKVDKVSGKDLSTNDYTTTEKNKLAGIEAGANKYTLPVATSSALGGVKSGTDITVDASGNVSINDDSHNHVISNVDGLQSALDAVGDDLAEHTENADIHFTAEERTKLSGIATGANKYTHPTSGVAAGTYKSVTVDANGHVTGGTNPTTLAGYGITDADAKGAADTALTNAKSYTDTKISDLINSAPTTLDTLGEIATAMEENADVVAALDEAVGTKANASDLTSHTGDTTVHITSTERTNWNVAKTHADSAHAPSNAQKNSDITKAEIEAKLTGSITSHNHDGQYYTETEVDDLLDGKAESSHSHAIADVSGLQSALDGKAGTSHGTHVSYSTTAPVMDGTASVGSASTVARSDHRHPTDTSRAAAADLTSHTGNTSNPHSVTKSQVGLGDVPNVATNDQTPTFTAATTLATLTSGEKISVAFGKIAKAITDLISHIGNKSNPHGVTISQIGAAASSHTHDDIYYTETEIDSKLSGKSDTSHTHSSYVNQNAFSNVTVGSTTIAADSTTDTLTLVAGSNVTLTPDATNDKVTIAATDTVYTHPTSHPASMITGLATVATSGSYNDLSNKPTIPSAYTHPSYTARTGKPTANQTPAFGDTATVSQITSDASGHVTAATDRTITIPSTLSNGTGTAGLIKTSSTVTSSSGYTACPVISGVPYYKDTDTTYSAATTSANGLMTSAMVTKLNGIATGATANTGTITGVSANGTSVATSGVANIPAASTSAYGVTKLSSSTSSTSTTLAATASAVKAAYDLANRKASVPTRSSTTTTSSAISADDNTYKIYTALASSVAITCPTTAMSYGAIVRVTFASGGKISGLTNSTHVDGDNYQEAVSGETWEFSILDCSVICKNLTKVS